MVFTQKTAERHPNNNVIENQSKDVVETMNEISTAGINVSEKLKSALDILGWILCDGDGVIDARSGTVSEACGGDKPAVQHCRMLTEGTYYGNQGGTMSGKVQKIFSQLDREKGRAVHAKLFIMFGTFYRNHRLQDFRGIELLKIISSWKGMSEL